MKVNYVGVTNVWVLENILDFFYCYLNCLLKIQCGFILRILPTFWSVCVCVRRYAVIFELSNKMLYFMAYFLCFIFLVKRLPVLWKFSFSFSCVCLIWRLALLPKLSNKTFHSRFRFANTLLSLILDAARALCAVGGRFMFKRSRVCSALDHGCGTSNRSKLYTSFDLALNCAVYSHRMPPHRLARNSQREREREKKTERERACFCLLTRQSWNLIDVMSWETFYYFFACLCRMTNNVCRGLKPLKLRVPVGSLCQPAASSQTASKNES